MSENHDDRRVPLLDGVRGLAILLVLVNNIYPELPSRPPLDAVVEHLSNFGWPGVDLFFVLSGFLITGILYDTKSSSTYFRSFYARRFLRIFPLYYGTLVVLYFVIPALGLATAQQLHGLHQQRWYMWTYLMNLGYLLHGQTHLGTDHFWSLAVEEQFYLVWPFFVWLLDRRHLVALCITAMVASFVMRVAWLAHDLGPVWLYMLTPFRLDSLAVGSILALTLRGPGGAARARRWAGPLWRTCGPLALALLAWFEFTGSAASNFAMQVVGYPAIAFAFAAMLVLLMDADPATRTVRWLTGGTMRGFGRYSYAMYIFHPIVLVLLIRRWPWMNEPPAVWGTHIPLNLAVLAIDGVLTTALAVASWHLYEKHWLRLKRFFPYGRPVETVDVVERERESAPADRGLEPPAAALGESR